MLQVRVGIATKQWTERSGVEILVVGGGHFSLLQNIKAVYISLASFYPVGIAVYRRD
jgi:hypothetical protein